MFLLANRKWAALTEELGGDKVSAFTATNARQDPHHIRARPSLIARVRRADMIFCSGAGLEAGWLPILLQRGARAMTQPGKPGYLMASEHVPVLGKPAVVDRSMGDIHPEGNPHVHLDPRNVLKVGAELTRRLIAIDPANKAHYEGRAGTFTARWRESMAQWEQRARPLKGMKVIVHHTSFTYLTAWLELDTVATLEPKPGLPPPRRIWRPFCASPGLSRSRRFSARLTIRTVLPSGYQGKPRSPCWCCPTQWAATPKPRP